MAFATYLHYVTAVRNIVERGTGTLGMIPEAAPPGVHLKVGDVVDSLLTASLVSLGRTAGLTQDPERAILVLRALAGAFGLAAFYLAARAAACSRFAAGLASSGLGLSLGYWLSSTHAEQAVNGVAASAIAVYAAIRMLNGDGRTCALALLLSSLVVATIVNLTNIMLAVGLIGLTADRRQGAWQFVRTVAIRGSVYGGTVAICLVLAVSLVAAPETRADARFWLGVPSSGQHLSAAGLVGEATQAAIALAMSLVHFPAVGNSFDAAWHAAGEIQRGMLVAWGAIALAIVADPLIVVYFARSRLHRYRGALLIGLGTFLASSVVAWSYAQTHGQFWVQPLLGWWLVTAIACTGAATANRRTLWNGALAGIVTICGVTNLAWQFWPSSDVNQHVWRTVAEELTASQPDALFVSAGHAADPYVTYYGRRETLTIGRTSLDSPVQAEAALDQTRRRVEQQWARGAPVYVYGLSHPPAPGLESMQVWLTSRQRELRWTIADLTFEELFPDREDDPAESR